MRIRSNQFRRKHRVKGRFLAIWDFDFPNWSIWAQRNNVPLRQSYRRVAKRAAIMVARYTHAHQFKRTRRELKFLRTRLGRVIRDIRVRSPATTASSNASRSFSLWPIGYASSITASARGLCATRPRGRMHRQEQGADGVRVRLRSIGRHPGHQRRPVCLHAKALYGNSAATRWDRSSPSLSSRPALRPAVSMSTRLSRPQSQTEVPRLDRRPGTARHQTHWPRDAAASRRRSRHRPR